MKKSIKVIVIVVMTIGLTLLNVWAFIYANAQRPTPAIGGEYLLPPICIIVIVYTAIKLFEEPRDYV